MILKLATLFVLTLSFQANAAQFKTVKKNLSSEGLEAYVSYPVLLPQAVAPAYKKINAQVIDAVVGSNCDAQEAIDYQKSNGLGYSYNAEAFIVALNSNYVGYSISQSDFCGGAYPNYGTYYLTFNAQTGEAINMDEQIPNEKAYQAALDQYEKDNFTKASETYEKYQKQLAKIMLNEVKTNPTLDPYGCFSEGSDADKLENMIFPTISGLAKNKTVVLKTNPPHAMSVCEISVRVSYDKVKKFIDKKSILNQWLK